VVCGSAEQPSEEHQTSVGEVTLFLELAFVIKTQKTNRDK